MSEGTNSRVGKSRLFRVMNSAQIGNAPLIGSDKPGGGEEWVRFGRHNLFPEFCRGLADNCSPLNACVETKAQYIAGNGLEFLDENEKPIDSARAKWLELVGEETALLEATALDIALMNTMSWEVIYSQAGPASVHHIDVTRIRSAKKDAKGVVPGYYFSSNWAQARDPKYKPVLIPAWDQQNDGKVIIYRKSYKQQRDYYGEPRWIAVMVDAEVLVRVPVFNRTQLDTGFRPAVHAALTTTTDDANLEELDENFELAFTGDTGKSWILSALSTGEKLEFTKIERGDHAGELDKTRAVSKEEIFHSYGIPPILMGVNVNTGLSGKGLAITEELELFTNAKVKPDQKHIAESAKTILKACGIDVPIVRVKTLVPFKPAQDPALVRQTYLRRVNVGEDRIQAGMPVLTTDGNDPADDMSNWDEWMKKPLIEVGMKGQNADQAADQQTNQDNNA